jgi:hypothetical protein
MFSSLSEIKQKHDIYFIILIKQRTDRIQLNDSDRDRMSIDHKKMINLIHIYSNREDTLDKKGNKSLVIFSD